MDASWIFNQAASKTACYISTLPELCLFLLAIHCILNNLTMNSMDSMSLGSFYIIYGKN